MKNGSVIESFIRSTFKPGDMDQRLIKFILFFLTFAIELKTLIPVRIGRRIGKRNTSERYGIKRMHRFTKNPNLKPEMLNKILFRNFQKQVRYKHSIILAIDWTVIREKFCFLSISLVWDEGRSVPISFWGYKKKEMTKSQPQIEKDAIASVLQLLGKRKKIFLLADRGFDAPELLDFLVKYNVFYIIRASTMSNCRKSNGRRFKLSKRLLKKGQRRILSDIWYCERGIVKTNFYGIWNKDQKEPWLILSNIKFKTAQAAADLYSRRMTIEEMFKSLKNEQVGFDIKVVRLRHLDRWLRFLFLSALLFQLLAEVGKLMRQIPGIEKRYSLSSKAPKKQKFIFSIYMLAALVIDDIRIQLKYIGSRLYLKLPDTAWIYDG